MDEGSRFAICALNDRNSISHHNCGWRCSSGATRSQLVEYRTIGPIIAVAAFGQLFEGSAHALKNSQPLAEFLDPQ